MKCMPQQPHSSHLRAGIYQADKAAHPVAREVLAIHIGGADVLWVRRPRVTQSVSRLPYWLVDRLKSGAGDKAIDCQIDFGRWQSLSSARCKLRQAPFCLG